MYSCTDIGIIAAHKLTHTLFLEMSKVSVSCITVTVPGNVIATLPLVVAGYVQRYTSTEDL